MAWADLLAYHELGDPGIACLPYQPIPPQEGLYNSHQNLYRKRSRPLGNNPIVANEGHSTNKRTPTFSTGANNNQQASQQHAQKATAQNAHKARKQYRMNARIHETKLTMHCSHHPPSPSPPPGPAPHSSPIDNKKKASSSLPIPLPTPSSTPSWKLATSSPTAPTYTEPSSPFPNPSPNPTPSTTLAPRIIFYEDITLTTQLSRANTLVEKMLVEGKRALRAKLGSLEREGVAFSYGRW